MVVDLKIINGLVMLDGEIEKVDLAVDNEKITAIGKKDQLPRGEKTIDATGKYVIPGTVDPHVHIRDPGRPDRETFATGTKAAAAGGVTTVIEQPISTPPPYAPSIVRNRIRVAEEKSYVDFALFGAAGADQLGEITKLPQTGIVAYKTFLNPPPPGREEEFVGLTMSSDGEVMAGFRQIAKTNLICAVHAENHEIIKYEIERLKRNNRTDYRAHLESRPPLTEVETVEKIIRLGRETGVRLEFVHISTPEAMELIKKAKERGQEIYVETCPHYLFCTEEEMLRLGPFAKCNPPLRKAEMVKRLWDYVTDGTVDFIGSDHAPFLLEEKERGLNDIFASPSGFPGIQLRLPLLLDAINNNKLTLARAVELISKNPARIFELYPRKGIIRVGSDADLVIIDLDQEFVVRRENLYTKARDIARIYEGRKLKGMPKTTIVRGRIVMEEMELQQAKGWGRFIRP